MKMTTYEKIQSEIKNAMLNKDNVKRDCLRSIVSEIKNQTVNAGKEITEDIVLKCIQKSVKQHKDSIESFKAGGRDDLAEKELEELKHIEVYLPKMLSEDETKIIIENILTNVEATKKNMGIIMKQLPSDVDKKIASKLLAKMLT
jgi:uncharacterized protein YqeY